jgi:hypothetical protein
MCGKSSLYLVLQHDMRPHATFNDRNALLKDLENEHRI